MLMKLFLFVMHCAIVFAQFIDAPTAFNTAELYVPPTGTSVYTFGGSEAYSATEFLTTPSGISTATSNPTQTTQAVSIETSSTFTSVEIPPFSSSIELETSTASSQAISSIPSVATTSTLMTSIGLTASISPSQAAVETVFETHYTTLPCTTSSDVSIGFSQQPTSSDASIELIQQPTSSGTSVELSQLPTNGGASIELSQQPSASSTNQLDSLSTECVLTPLTKRTTIRIPVTSIIRSTVFITHYSTLTQPA